MGWLLFVERKGTHTSITKVHLVLVGGSEEQDDSG